MRVTCENCGENISLPNKKNRIRKSSNKVHTITVCKQCGHRNFVDAITRYDNDKDYSSKLPDVRRY